MPVCLVALWLCSLCLSLPLVAGDLPPQRRIDLNAATATELMELPRVGASTARRILSFRRAHGGFQRLEELMNIKGIGEKAYLRLTPHLTLGPAPAPGQDGR